MLEVEFGQLVGVNKEEAGALPVVPLLEESEVFEEPVNIAPGALRQIDVT